MNSTGSKQTLQSNVLFLSQTFIIYWWLLILVQLYPYIACSTFPSSAFRVAWNGIFFLYVCAQTYYIEVGEDVSLCILLVDLLNIRPYHHQQFQMGDIRRQSWATQTPTYCRQGENTVYTHRQPAYEHSNCFKNYQVTFSCIYQTELRHDRKRCPNYEFLRCHWRTHLTCQQRNLSRSLFDWWRDEQASGGNNHHNFS